MEIKEANTHAQANKPTQPKKKSMLQKSVDPATARLITQYRNQINKGSSSRKIQDSDIIKVAIEKLDQHDIKLISESLVTATERLKALFEKNRNKDKDLSYDKFLDQLMQSHQLYQQSLSLQPDE